MGYLNIILPGALVVIAFALRLVVDQRMELPDFIERVLEMPIELVFLAGSFVVAFTLENLANRDLGLLAFVLGFVVVIFIVWLSKRSVCAFEKGHYWRMGFFALLSYLPASGALAYSVYLIAP